MDDGVQVVEERAYIHIWIGRWIFYIDIRRCWLLSLSRYYSVPTYVCRYKAKQSKGKSRGLTVSIWFFSGIT